ncbi:MAG: hypothetical protein HUK23_00945 [Sphaerochaetaceae bacterium]|nr:hypothetical protein [Sphaerochaetaceae bacterium]
MKKLLLTIFVCCVGLCLFADNGLRIIPVSSPIYQEIQNIYLITGHAMPSATGPWSTAELSLMLEKIDRDEVPSALLGTYDRLVKELTIEDVEGIDLDISLITNLEFFAHSNTDGTARQDENGQVDKMFVGRKYWGSKVRNASPFFGFDFEFQVNNNIDVFFEAAALNSYITQPLLGNSVLGSNLPFYQQITSDFKPLWGLDANMPYRAYAVFGGKNWNVQIGRDRLSWGLGQTGNMVISDNLAYHEALQFKAFSKNFKFTYIISSFPHKENYYTGTGTSRTYQGSKIDENFVSKGVNLYIAHRFEGRLFNDKLALAFTEAIMYASAEDHIEATIFIPVALYHNMYKRMNANSTLALEADYAIMRGWNVYGQFLMDEMAFSTETVLGEGQDGHPNAFGYMLGTRYSHVLRGGLVVANLEAAHTDAYLYLRYSANDEDASKNPYGLDYVVSNRFFVTGEGRECIEYDEHVLGYDFGPDANVVNLNVYWDSLNKLSVAGNLFFMAHGTHDMWTQWSGKGSASKQEYEETYVTPTTNHKTTNNYRFNDESDRDAVSYTLDVGFAVGYEVNQYLSLKAQFDFVNVWNTFNYCGTNDSDCQAVFTLSYKY